MVTTMQIRRNNLDNWLKKGHLLGGFFVDALRNKLLNIQTNKPAVELFDNQIRLAFTRDSLLEVIKQLSFFKPVYMMDTP